MRRFFQALLTAMFLAAPGAAQPAPALSQASTGPTVFDIVNRRAHVVFTVDVSKAPELKPWAEKAARTCAEWYPRIARYLRSDHFVPSHHIHLTFNDDPHGVAGTGGDEIGASLQWFKAHPDDTGALIHESVHVIQHYPRYDPVWLVEGIADYIRWYRYEPRPRPGRLDPDRIRYSDSYRTTAAFLDFVTRHHNRNLVPRLNAALRADTYQPSLFQTLTGKTLDQLDSEWKASLRARKKTSIRG